MDDSEADTGGGRMKFASKRMILLTEADSNLWGKFVQEVGTNFRPPGISPARWKAMSKGINRLGWDELAICYVQRIPDRFRRIFFGTALAAAWAAEEELVGERKSSPEEDAVCGACGQPCLGDRCPYCGAEQ
jgi:hypothetical protein